MSLMKQQKTDLGNTTAAVRDKLNRWHGPKFRGAYAMFYRVRGVFTLLRQECPFISMHSLTMSLYEILKSSESRAVILPISLD